MQIIHDSILGLREGESPKTIGKAVSQASANTPANGDYLLYVNRGILYKIDYEDFVALMAAIDPRVSSVGDVATVDVNCDNYNFVDVAAIAQNFTIANPTGTPVNMQKLLYRIKDDGTARTIDYGDQFQSRGIIKPTTTIAGKYTTMLFIRNTATSTWDLIGLDQEPA
jgi:hypothetical protein